MACDEALSKRWSKLIRDAGVRDINLHSARHTCGTTLHLRGVRLSVVAAWLGHADASVTARICAHSQPDALKAASVTLGGVDKHREIHRNGGGNEVGSNPLGAGQSL